MNQLMQNLKYMFVLVLSMFFVIGTATPPKTIKVRQKSEGLTKTSSQNKSKSVIQTGTKGQNKSNQTTLTRTTNPVKMTATEIYSKYSSAVFRVYAGKSPSVVSQGSAFFITPTLAVSNYHVFRGAYIENIQLHLVDGTVLYVDEVIENSEDSDYVVFRVKDYKGKIYIPIELDMNSIQVGQTCYAIGSPRDYENTFSQGLISQTKYLKTEHFIQTNAPIDHGSSGGVLLNEYGKAIGITSGGRDDSGANLNFARSIDVLSVTLRGKLRAFYKRTGVLISNRK